MNVNPRISVALLRSFWQRGLCAPGCAVVLSFKNFCGSRQGWAAEREAQRIALGEMCGAEEPREFHLLANGQGERTVILTLRAFGD